MDEQDPKSLKSDSVYFKNPTSAIPFDLFPLRRVLAVFKNVNH